jgi:hypothetical protein
LRNVCFDDEAFTAASCYTVGGSLSISLPLAVRKSDRRSCSRHHHRNRCADASRPSGDEHNFSKEAYHNRSDLVDLIDLTQHASNQQASRFPVSESLKNKAVIITKIAFFSLYFQFSS